LSKGAKPREISEESSLYRLIITYFLQKLRPYVSQLGTNLLAVELGTVGFLHEPKEQRTMRVLKAEPGYDSDGSETMDTKQAIEQYTLAAEHALLGLSNRSETQLSSPLLKTMKIRRGLTQMLMMILVIWRATKQLVAYL
jgi:hypothetical protein